MLYGFMPLRFRAEEGGGPDVDSVKGFHEALVAAGGGEMTDEAREILDELNQDRSVAGGLAAGLTTEEESAPPPQSAPTPVAEGEERVAPPEEEAPQAEPSPLEKQLSDSQSFIGRQAETIGELRARLEALEQARQAPEEEEVGPGFTIPDEQGWNSLTETFDALGGPGLMSRIASSDPDSYEAALALWKAGGDTDIASAYLYEANVAHLMAEQEGSGQPAAPQLPPEVQAVVARERMTATFNELAAGLDQEEARALAPHVQTALSETGPLHQRAIADALASDDQAQQKAAFNEIVSLARAKIGQAKAPAEAVRAAASVVAKRRAQTPASSGRPSSTSGETELPTSLTQFEEIRKADPARAKALATALVAKQFRETENTSVAEGLKEGRG